MNYETYITVATTANKNQIYPIYKDEKYKIGEATFVGMNGDLFIFDIQALTGLKLENYELKATVDLATNELIEFRAVSNS